jgi:hypothetical protein
MINKIKDIEKSQLDRMIIIGLESINHKNLLKRFFTLDDIRILTSYDGVNVTIEFKDTKTNVSIIDSVYQKTIETKTDQFINIVDSPLAAQFKYRVILNIDLTLFIHCGDDKSFKDAIENKIMFYNEHFELCYIHEGFQFMNDVAIKYLISEFYIGYDFDKEYNPVGKLFVGNQRGNFNGIVDKYNSKFRTYQYGFNVEDENVLLKHYILMDSLESFDEIFTQFYGPLPKPLDIDLVHSQLKLAHMVLFNQ